MREFIQRLNTSVYGVRFFEWARLITITGSVQLVVQLLGLASAVLIIRLLPSSEYALYTLANSMLANMIILSDSGVSIGVMSEGGKVWRDPQRLGSVIITGLGLRKRFAIYSMVVIAPVLFVLLRHHGANWIISTLITLSIIPGFFATSIGAIYEIGPKLHQEILPLQKIQLGSAFGRMIILCLSVFTLPLALIACFTTGLSQLWANKKLLQLVPGYADLKVKTDPIVRKRILEMSKRLVPEAIYGCLSGQITIWLISIFGSTSSVAEAGALTRLSMVLNFFSIMVGSLIIPRFSRLNNNKKLLLKRYLQIQFCMLLVGLGIVTASWIFSSQILYILGPAYSGLHKEVVLMMTGSAVYAIWQSSFYLCSSKGWVINPFISIPVSIITIITGVVFLDISNLQGVFILNILVAGVNVSVQTFYGLFKILKQQSE